jgi:histone H3/H4
MCTAQVIKPGHYLAERQYRSHTSYCRQDSTDTMARSKSVAVKNARDAEARLAAKAPSKKRRWRPDTVAKREIRKWQKSASPLIPRRPIRKIVRGMLADLSKSGDARMTRNAFEHLFQMSSVVMTEALGAAERVRVAENRTKSIRSRHLRVGRATLGIRCLSDAQLPMEFSARRLVAPPPARETAKASEPSTNVTLSP